MGLNFLREQTLSRYRESTHVKRNTAHFHCKPLSEFLKASSPSAFLGSHRLVDSSPRIFLNVTQLHFSINIPEITMILRPLLYSMAV